MTTIELKNCPACSGVSQIRDKADYVRCTNGDCGLCGPSGDPAGEKWNALPRRGDAGAEHKCMRTDGLHDGAVLTLCSHHFQTLGVETEHDSALRDQFAIHAPPVPEWFKSGNAHGNQNADWPYYYADTVIAERNKKGGE